jgi:hypothetical protein
MRWPLISMGQGKIQEKLGTLIHRGRGEISADWKWMFRAFWFPRMVCSFPYGYLLVLMLSMFISGCGGMYFHKAGEPPTQPFTFLFCSPVAG